MASLDPKTKRRFLLPAVAVVGIVLLIVLFNSLFITVEAGFQAVLFRPFAGGLDKENLLGPGFHMVSPWNTVFTYDARIQERTEDMDVLAANGLNIHVDLSFRYRVVPSEVGYLHEEIGQTYADKIVTPEVRAATRKVIGKYLPEELYSTKRDAIQNEIFTQTEANVKPKHIHLDAVLIRSVKLPELIKGAIERKLEQQQQRDEYEFRIQKEAKEAERKRIEAQGIKDFQDIVSDGISDKLLKWKGIEATQELANSKNSKIIVIGGSDGLPVILGND
ncbi:MAG: prohibitin family protein [Bacteroidia bacterium]